MTKLVIGYNYKELGIYTGKEDFCCICSECGKSVKTPHIFESENFGTIALGSECIKKIELILEEV